MMAFNFNRNSFSTFGVNIGIRRFNYIRI
jgi:hypothetical protein